MLHGCRPAIVRERRDAVLCERILEAREHLGPLCLRTVRLVTEELADCLVGSCTDKIVLRTPGRVKVMAV